MLGRESELGRIGRGGTGNPGLSMGVDTEKRPVDTLELRRRYGLARVRRMRVSYGKGKAW